MTRRHREPSYFRKESAVLLFLARWGQASTPELPYGASPELEETDPLPSMVELGYMCKVLGPCPRTGTRREVWTLTNAGLTSAKKRGFETPSVQIDEGKLTRCYFIARNAKGGYMFFGQVRSHPATGMCLLHVHQPGYLERAPLGRVWRVEEMHGWEFYEEGAPAHAAALREEAAQLHRQAVRDLLQMA